MEPLRNIPGTLTNIHLSSQVELFSRDIPRHLRGNVSTLARAFRGCFHRTIEWHVKQISCLSLAIRKKGKIFSETNEIVSRDIVVHYKFQYKHALTLHIFIEKN